MAVMTFFVLSGFVIAEALETYYQGRPGAFLINRLLRIFPPFFLALAFSVLVHWGVFELGDLQLFDPLSASQRAAMFSASNLIANTLCLVVIYGLAHFGVILDYLFVRFVWAVAVELHFYYVAASLVFITGLSRIRTNLDGVVATLLVGLFIAAMFSVNKMLFYAVWIPYFVLGVAIFYVLTGAEGRSMHKVGNARRRRWIVWGGLGIVGVNWHACSYMSKNMENWIGVDLLILNLLVGVLIFLGRVSVNGQLKAVDRWLGDLTYPLYLNHYAVSIATLSLAPEEYRGIPLFIANFLICVAVSIGLSNLSEPVTRSIRNRIRGALV